jgi:molybdenum cofactor synthesis domain-containing protein
MNKKITIKSVNISVNKGTIKHPAESINLVSGGVEGDAHAGYGIREVSLLGVESIEKFEKENSQKINYGEFAENITTSGLLLYKTHPLDKLISDGAELEITQIGKECHGTSCTIFKETGNCIMPKEGIFCRVIKPGILKPGMELKYKPKIFAIHIVTLSDRASRGEYEDKSGPHINELLEKFFTVQNLLFKIRYSLLPDDPERLRSLLLKDHEDNTDIIFTTGGTGIGPRDFTPDVIKPLLDKEIPGIMEIIRMKYGVEKPNVLVSRSIAGVLGQSLIFSLPGSVRAVDEYITEILKSLMHLIYMLHGLDRH